MTAGTKVEYQASAAHAQPSLARILAFRSVNPLLADWLCPKLVLAEDHERLQLLEGLLGMPIALVRSTRVPGPEHLPPGKLQNEFLDPELLRRGVIAAPKPPGEEDEDDEIDDQEADKGDGDGEIIDLCDSEAGDQEAPAAAVEVAAPRKERTPISLLKVAEMARPKIYGPSELAMSNMRG